MKVRIFSPSFPYPPESGAHQVIYDQARTYAEEGHTVELVCWKDSAETIAGRRAMPYFKPFHPAIQVTAWKPNPVSRLRRVARSLVSELASPELYYYPPAADRRAELGAVDLEIYHYSFAYAWLRRARSSAQRVVHYHNLESELFALRAESARDPVSAALHQKSRYKLYAHEIALAGLVSELWFLSPADLERTKARLPKRITSFRFVPPTFDPALRAFREGRYRPGPPTLGFIGTLDFHPNRESLAWVLREVAPLLKGFRLVIAGRAADDELRQLASAYPFVEWLGFVPDAEEFWSQIDGLLAPHLSGSGTRIKILEALASGIPTFTTPAAVGLMPPELAASPLLFVSGDPREWVVGFKTLHRGT